MRLDKIQGFILNTENNSKNLLAFLYYMNPANFFSSRKHWIAIRRIHDTYYNLDSKLDAPQAIGDERALLKYLEEKNGSPECEILLVVEKEVADSHECYIDGS